MRRLTVTLPPEYAERLARMAARAHVSEETLASSLLAQAIDDAGPDAAHIAALLETIPGAWTRIEDGVADARAGRIVALDQA